MIYVYKSKVACLRGQTNLIFVYTQVTIGNDLEIFNLLYFLQLFN
jgi:hypothetical protein